MRHCSCFKLILLITHANGSRVRKAFSGVCDSVCDFVRVSVCPHGKNKTAETKIPNLSFEVYKFLKSVFTNFEIFTNFTFSL